MVSNFFEVLPGEIKHIPYGNHAEEQIYECKNHRLLKAGKYYK
jgi:hypothetical protein